MASVRRGCQACSLASVSVRQSRLHANCALSTHHRNAAWSLANLPEQAAHQLRAESAQPRLPESRNQRRAATAAPLGSKISTQ